MSDAWLRRIVMLAIVLVALVGTVSFFSTRMAGNDAWFAGFAAPVLLLLLAYLDLGRRPAASRA